MTHSIAIGELLSIVDIKRKQAKELHRATADPQETVSNKSRTESLGVQISALEKSIKTLSLAASLFVVLCWVGCAQPLPAFSDSTYPWTNVLTNASGEEVPPPSWDVK